MPELPEVEMVVRSLQPLVGRRITAVDWIGLGRTGRTSAALRQLLPKNPLAQFSRVLSGARIEDVRRYGKNIVMELRFPNSPSDRHDSASHLMVHLGMTGKLLWERAPDPQRPHTHVVLALDAPGLWLHYSDSRRFGKLRLLSARPEDEGTLGPDPLAVAPAEFYDRLRARRTTIKALLLDQRFLRGLGNIYADESLFRANMHPSAMASRLTRAQAERLHRSIREVLAAAIELGGSSVSNYVNANGEAGWFQQEHQVYRRTGERCGRCRATIQRIVVAGRSTHFCPRCQRHNIRAERVNRRRSSGMRGAR